MPICAWTGREIPFGTGKMYVKKDGKVLWFSSRQAEKNFLKMKRNPREARYTEAARHAKSQRMAELAHEKEDAKKESKPVAKKASAKKKAPAKKTPVKKAAKKGGK